MPIFHQNNWLAIFRNLNGAIGNSLRHNPVQIRMDGIAFQTIAHAVDVLADFVFTREKLHPLNGGKAPILIAGNQTQAQVLLIIGNFRLGKKRLNKGGILVELQLIALGQFRAFAIETAQALPGHGSATAQFHRGPEPTTDRQVGPQAAHRRAKIQPVAFADVMGAPGRNGSIVDPGAQVAAGNGNAGIMVCLQAEPAKSDFDLWGIEIVVQQAICPEKRELVHGAAGGHAHMLVAVPAGVLNEGQHSGFEDVKAHRPSLPALEIHPG